MKKFYEFHMNLDTPYKWGSGYGNASRKEIESNKQAFAEIFNFLKCEDENFTISKKERDGGCDSWYNKKDEEEEIYAHPMELSGVLEISKIFKLARFIKESEFENTKFIDVRIYGEVRKYTFTEFANELLSKVDELIPEIASHNYCSVAMNYDFKEFGFKFKRYGFVDTKFNREQKMQKEFGIKLINEKLKKYEKESEMK